MKPNRPISDNEIQLLQETCADKFSLVNELALSTRQITLCDIITVNTFEMVKNLYDQMIEEDDKLPIHVLLNTPGGDMNSMIGIMNLFLLSKIPIFTYLMGETCSAGCWIYLCGHKRFAPKTDFIGFMLHPIAYNSDLETPETHEARVEYYKQTEKFLISFAAKRTKISKSMLKKLSEHKTKYYIGDEIFKYGIATDELTTSTYWLTNKSVKKSKKSNKETLVETKSTINNNVL